MEGLSPPLDRTSKGFRIPTFYIVDKSKVNQMELRSRGTKVTIAVALVIVLLTVPWTFYMRTMVGELTVSNESGLDVHISLYLGDGDMTTLDELLLETALEDNDSVDVAFPYTYARYPDISLHVRYLIEFYDDDPFDYIVYLGPERWRTRYIIIDVDSNEFDYTITVNDTSR